MRTLLLLLIVALPCAPADAAVTVTASTQRVDVSGPHESGFYDATTLSVVGDEADDDVVLVSEGKAFVVTDVAGVSVGAGCEVIDDRTARCPGTALAGVGVELGAGDDRI